VTCAYVGLSKALGRNVARRILELHGVNVAPEAIVDGPPAAMADPMSDDAAVAAASRRVLRR
jgi:hypothetical protein